MPDLSKRAVDMAVLSGSLQHPAVVYPAAAGVIGGLGAALLTASPLMIAGAAVGGGVAVLALGVNYLFRRDYFATRYIEAAHANLVEYRKALLENLVADLNAVKAKEAIAQLERFGEKLATFEDVLDDKLGRKELTFARFLGIADIAGDDAKDRIAVPAHDLGISGVPAGEAQDRELAIAQRG